MKKLAEQHPLLILAPMQDVTDLPFWRVMHAYGGPDVYWTEYFRVHRDSRPEKQILASIRENPAAKPVVAQMIGDDIPSLIRTAKALQKEKIVAIDLNLGCPAPIVCRKSAGGGLLRAPERIDEILRALRAEVSCAFTVKTRIGYECPDEFDRLLEVFASHAMDALTVHGRTVKEMYGPVVHYDRIAQAVKAMPCPVFANGNVRCVESAKRILEGTGAAGLMIGRGAIRNPWVFRQIRAAMEGTDIPRPTLRDLREYVERLYRETRVPELLERLHVNKMKKYLNFIGPGLSPGDAFLHAIRRAEDELAFFSICDEWLDREGEFGH